MKRNIKMFKKYVRYYIDIFNLHNWEVVISEGESDTSSASCLWWSIDDYPNGCGQIASIYYDKNWIKNKKLKRSEISRTAFHEVIELLLSKLRDYSENTEKVISSYEIDNEIHNIIRIMENKILPLISKLEVNK